MRIALASSTGVLLTLLLLNRGVQVRLGEEADVTPTTNIPDMGLTKLPASYLNPLLTVGTQMEDAIRGQEAALGGPKRPRRAILVRPEEPLRAA